MATQTYQLASRRFLEQSRDELAKGDTQQASEKGWGAAAQMVKAVAEQRGWEHHGHRHLFVAVRRLRNETGDEDIRRLFDVASSLHTNFYEDWKEPQSIAEGLHDMVRFIDKLAPFLQPEDDG